MLILILLSGDLWNGGGMVKGLVDGQGGCRRNRGSGRLMYGRSGGPLSVLYLSFTSIWNLRTRLGVRRFSRDIQMPKVIMNLSEHAAVHESDSAIAAADCGCGHHGALAERFLPTLFLHAIILPSMLAQHTDADMQGFKSPSLPRCPPPSGVLP